MEVSLAHLLQTLISVLSSAVCSDWSGIAWLFDILCNILTSVMQIYRVKILAELSLDGIGWYRTSASDI